MPPGAGPIKYPSIFEAADDAMAIHDLSARRVLSINNCHSSMFGYSADDLNSGGVDLLSVGKPPFSGHEAIGWIKKAANQGPQSFEWKAKDSEGQEFWTKVSLKRTSINGKDRVLAIVRDITQHKQTQLALEHSKERLWRLAAQMASIREEERRNLARELDGSLGQPLALLKEDLNWLKRNLPSRSKSLRLKTRSMSATADSTLNSLLGLTRQLNPGRLEDLGLVAAMEWRARQLEDATGTQCVIDATRFNHTALPRQMAATLLRAFREALDNVNRHSGANLVLVTLESNQASVRLDIKDNGVGIKDGSLLQADGLGLAGIRHKVDLWGGVLSLKGAPQQGSILQIRLPLNQRHRPGILIADTQPIMRRGLKDLMEREIAGAWCLEAPSARGGLRLVREHAFDLVLMDVSPPALEGLQCIKALKEQNPDLPVLAISHQRSDELALRALRSGASGFLPNNAQPEDYIKTVKALLSDETLLSQSIFRKLADSARAHQSGADHSKLSDREYQVFLLMAAGNSPGQIAQELALSPKTVSTYRSRILDKLNMSNAAELIAYAIKKGLV